MLIVIWMLLHACPYGGLSKLHTHTQISIIYPSIYLCYLSKSVSIQISQFLCLYLPFQTQSNQSPVFLIHVQSVFKQSQHWHCMWMPCSICLDSDNSCWDSTTPPPLPPHLILLELWHPTSLLFHHANSFLNCSLEKCIEASSSN